MSRPIRRADAERNRERIVAAARSAFADAGAEISMAEIARRAGVGMATLYRNFPGRRELLEALYVDEVDAICAAATTIAERVPAQAALRAWLERVFDFLVAKGPVGRELLRHAGGDDPFFSDNRDRVTAAGRPLLAAALEAGVVRDDVGLDQMLDLVHAMTTIDGEPTYVRAILEASLDGLRTPGA